MAHIRIRSSSSYTITIYLGRKENGSKKCYYETFYGTFKEVKRRAKQLELELKSKPKGIPRKHLLKINELLNRWLNLKRKKVTPETFKKYSWLVEKLELAVGDFPAYTFDAWEIEQRLGVFKDYSVRTQVDIYNILKSALNLIARNDESLKEIINGFEPPKIREIKKPKITKNDLRKFIEVAKNDKNYLILRFIVLCGFRIVNGQ